MKQKKPQESTMTNYLLNNLFDVDEFILKLSSCIPEGQGFDAELIKSSIKRIYFTFEIEKTKEAGIKYLDGTEKEVTKNYYDENIGFFKINYKDKKLVTSLNYNDFYSLVPLIEIVNHSPTLFEREPVEVVNLFDEIINETKGDTSKSMLISTFITELDKSYKKLECLLNDSLIPLNKLQKIVIRRYLHFAKEVFRLLLIKYLPFFEKLIEEINYVSEVFEDVTKNLTGTSFENKQDSDLFKKQKEVYKKFLEYRKKHIVEPYVDYSYLFQRLTHEKMIQKITHEDFIYWLFNKKYISEKNKEKFLDKRGFYSLDKCCGKGRENNFNNIFNL